MRRVCSDALVLHFGERGDNLPSSASPLARSGHRLYARARLPGIKIVARRRHRILAFGQLELEHHETARAKDGLATGQIELPHPAKSFVIEFPGLFTVLHEAFAPVFERVGVVVAQNLYVRDVETGLLDCTQYFGKGREVSSREYVLGNPGIGRGRRLGVGV